MTISIRELRFRAINIRCGGRTMKYQRDGQWGSFPADAVLALVEAVEAVAHDSSLRGYCLICEVVDPNHDKGCPMAAFSFGDGDDS